MWIVLSFVSCFLSAVAAVYRKSGIKGQNPFWYGAISLTISTIPEYKDAFGKTDGNFALEVMKVAPFPEDIVKLGEEGIREIWHKAKLRGRGYSKATGIVKYASNSIGRKDGSEPDKFAVKCHVEDIISLDEKLSIVEAEINAKCMEIPHAENILEIAGLGKNIVAGIISSMGDIERFDDAKEIQKLSGLNLVANNSGKHNGETKISHRGRKELRTWLFQGAKSVVAHSEEFKLIHEYYTTRAKNPLKKMQSLIVIACKLLRISKMIVPASPGFTDSGRSISPLSG